MVLSLMEMDSKRVSEEGSSPSRNTASSIDSYKVALQEVLEKCQPVYVFEYGPGISTKIISEFDSVVSIDSVEHNREWLEKARSENLSKVKYIFEPDLKEYAFVIGSQPYYDLIFIDGRRREECLDFTRQIKMMQHSVVVLHDAKRESYQKHILGYQFQEWRDDGHTVILSESADVMKRFK